MYAPAQQTVPAGNGRTRLPTSHSTVTLGQSAVHTTTCARPCSEFQQVLGVDVADSLSSCHLPVLVLASGVGLPVADSLECAVARAEPHTYGAVPNRSC